MPSRRIQTEYCENKNTEKRIEELEEQYGFTKKCAKKIYKEAKEKVKEYEKLEKTKNNLKEILDNLKKDVDCFYLDKGFCDLIEFYIKDNKNLYLKIIKAIKEEIQYTEEKQKKLF